MGLAVGLWWERVARLTLVTQCTLDSGQRKCSLQSREGVPAKSRWGELFISQLHKAGEGEAPETLVGSGHLIDQGQPVFQGTSSPNKCQIYGQ